MAYTTPATAVAATVLTAAFLNTNLRDNIAWMATDSPCARAYSSINVSIANTTLTAPGLNSERFDNAALHSTSVNTSRFTIPTGGAGKYLTGASWQWAVSASGSYRLGQMYVNSTTAAAKITTQPSASHASDASLSTVYSLSVADYIELAVIQDSGGALNISTLGNCSPEVWLFWYRT